MLNCLYCETLTIDADFPKNKLKRVTALTLPKNSKIYTDLLPWGHCLKILLTNTNVCPLPSYNNEYTL